MMEIKANLSQNKRGKFHHRSRLPLASTGHWLVFLLAFAEFASVSVSGSTLNANLSNTEKYRAVWNGYETSIRPVCDHSRPTTSVVMAMALRQMIELDEPKQILVTNIWLRVAWDDCRLKWDTSQWNVDRQVVPYDTMWTPDLTLYDNAEEGLTGLSNYRLSVTSNGSVTQQVPVVVKSLCQLDVARFPFDTQRCRLTFGSWAYDGFEVNLTASDEPVDLSSYVTNGEWKVASFTAERIEPYFAGVPYPQVIFTLVLERRSLFYILSLLFPCALIQLIAGLAFLLPPDTNEKVGLEVTVLLSLAVMQLVILNLIPASSETLPLIGVYFVLAMSVVSISCLMTVIVLAVHYPNRHRPLPSCARAVLYSWLARAFGVRLKDQLKQSGRHGAKAHDNDPDVTANLSSSFTRSSDSVRSGGVELELASPIPCRHHHHQQHHANTTARHYHDDHCGSGLQYHNDANVGYYYMTEGDRSRRVSRRPASADLSCAAFSTLHAEFQPPRRALGESAELQKVMNVCQQVLDHLKDGKEPKNKEDKDKDKDKDGRLSEKAARREWVHLAVLLDRLFLVVYCILTVVMFTYVYASIV